MARWLITGAAGGVGVHVTLHVLRNTKDDVVIVDSFRHRGYKDRLKPLLQAYPKRVKIIQHDLTIPFPSHFATFTGKVDTILHLAAMSDVQFSVDNPAYVIQNNINSTINLAEWARQHPPEAFVYFSTDEVYGPVAHPGDGHKEWSTHRPSNAYAASKAACEDILYSYWRSYGLPLIITNTMNNFGEMQSAEKFPVKIQKWVEAGEEVIIHGSEREVGSRFYIHSRNVADALLFILKREPTTHQTGLLDEPDRYHIVGETNYNNFQLAQTIAGMMGKPLHIKFQDFHKDNPAHDIHYGLQDNKLRPGGWKQPRSTEDSLRETIKWQQEHPEWL